MRPAFALGALLLLAACLAVALAGSAAAQAKKTAAKARPARSAKADTVLARVGGQPITRAEVERRLAELPEPYRQNYSTPEGRQQFLERMVEERVWLLGARKHGVDTRPELRRQIEQAERDLLIRTYVNEIMAANPAPSDSDARIFYDAHQVDYRTPATVTLSHILLKNEAEARRVRQMAAKQDWKKLVARFSADSATRAHDGELGTVTREGIFAAMISFT
jgi:parvulin-like peptidyl-prolyl isomerase